jgi:transposase InsO family protein/transposase-like protein
LGTYTKEQKKAAVELFIKYDKRPRQVMVELGYPTKSTLRAWYKEYLNTGDFQDGRIERKRLSQVFTNDQVNEAVKYYVEHGRNLNATVRAMGYPNNPHTLVNWIKKLAPDSRRSATPCLTKQVYNNETKAKSLSDFLAKDDFQSAQEIAEKNGVTREVLYFWASKAKEKGYTAAMKPKEKHTETKEELTEELLRLRQEAEELRKENHRLQIENDLLIVAAEVVKKGKGISLASLTNREKALTIDALRSKYRLAELIQAIGIARSTYFAQEKVLKAKDKHAEDRKFIRSLFKNNYSCYGYRRIHSELARTGVRLSEKVVRRIMREEALKVPSFKRPKKFSSYVGEVTPPAENLLRRDFKSDAPNRKWLTDITEFHIPAGRVYLSPMIDCFDGMPLTWTIGNSPSSELANTMLDKAISTLPEGEKPIVHSDRGGHYRWPGWIDRMNRAGLVRSMSKKGCSPDNSACEGFFGRIKNEMFYGRNWKDWSLNDFMCYLDRYLNWFCSVRIKNRLGNKSPLVNRQELGMTS